jgi:prepilin-type N-terminal cleavage/methylation domain-containing protein
MTNHRNTPPHGLTLLELVMVLAILAVLTAVAVQSLEGMADQTRFEATQRTLELIRTAIVSENTANTPVTGFVADMGRLPSSLEELLVPPADAAPFGLHNAPAPFTNIRVPGGWRGPYLRLPVGSQALGVNLPRDGWGNPLTFVSDSAGSCTISSAAAPRSPTNPSYNQELLVSISPTQWQAVLITGLLARGGNTSSGSASGTSDSWSATLLAPPTASGGVQQVAGTISISPEGDVAYSISSNLAIGPRVLCVTKNGTLYRQGVYLTLRPGGTHVIDFHTE